LQPQLLVSQQLNALLHIFVLSSIVYYFPAICLEAPLFK